MITFPIINGPEFSINYAPASHIFQISKFPTLKNKYKQIFKKSINLDNAEDFIIGEELFGFILNPIASPTMIHRATIYLANSLLDNDILFSKLNNLTSLANSLQLISQLLKIHDRSH